MSGNKFTEFDNTSSPDLTNEIVGFGDVSGTVKEKRWLVSAWKTFWQGVLNITLLDREQDNYLKVTGSTGFGATVTIEPDGLQSNLSLILKSKGATGEIFIDDNTTVNGTLDVNGNTTIVGSLGITGTISATGAASFPSGINSGDIVLQSGTLTMVTGDASLANGDLSLLTGDINMSGGDINVTSGIVNLTSSDFTMNANTMSLSSVTGLTFGGSFVFTGTPVTVFGANLNVASGVFSSSGKVYGDTDILSGTYIRAGSAIGQTADVSSVQGGGLITKEFNQYSTVATIGDCATLPVLGAEASPSLSYDVYLKVVVRNDGANAMDVFPNVGGTIDGGAADAAVSVGAGSVTTFYGQDVAGVNTWFTA